MKIDQNHAASFIGKRLLVGVTYLDHDETFLEQRQFHGEIVRINETEGIVLRIGNSDQEQKLPPDLNSLQKAPEGEFRLRSTGEVVVNPDFLTTWTITKPKPGDSEV